MALEAGVLRVRVGPPASLDAPLVLARVNGLPDYGVLNRDLGVGLSTAYLPSGPFCVQGVCQFTVATRGGAVAELWSTRLRVTLGSTTLLDQPAASVRLT